MEDRERDKIIEAISDSQSHFEKNLVFLSAGSLALSIGFVEKFAQQNSANCNWLIIFSWLFLAGTLLLNLASHLISVENSSKAREEMDKDLPYDDLYANITNRNNAMRKINWTTFYLFALGVASGVIYCSINL
jgi:hypothetical protein